MLNRFQVSNLQRTKLREVKILGRQLVLKLASRKNVKEIQLLVLRARKHKLKSKKLN
jgi:hypothetical protein